MANSLPTFSSSLSWPVELTISLYNYYSLFLDPLKLLVIIFRVGADSGQEELYDQKNGETESLDDNYNEAKGNNQHLFSY